MTPGAISARVVADRVALVRGLLGDLRGLPLDDYRVFAADRRNVWAAESCLRRSLEALFDLSRHLLSKGFGVGVAEYKVIAVQLQAEGVLSIEDAATLRILAGYRNRLVHYYNEISEEELYQVCSSQLGDVERVLTAIENWIRAHPELVDRHL
jgi:uncharacterized protein YutE (UPF0331/DUF86 family)